MMTELYGTSPAMWDHTVLPATQHTWVRPALTPARCAVYVYLFVAETVKSCAADITVTTAAGFCADISVVEHRHSRPPTAVSAL